MNRSIVCGTDGSQVSRWAARVAADLARELELELVLAHVVPDPPPFPYGDTRLRELQRRGTTEWASALLEQVAAGLPTESPKLQVLFGDPVDSLADMSREQGTELLVVGSRGRGRLAAAVLGSVSGRLASVAACPVLVVPSADAAHRVLARTVGGHVLCGVDRSLGSLSALAFAADLAESLQLELSATHIDGYGPREQRPPGTAGSVLRVDAGDPVERLMERASHEGASMLVVGSPSRGSWRAAALGSVPLELAARAPLPVVIVPATAQSLESLAEAMVAGSSEGAG